MSARPQRGRRVAVPVSSGRARAAATVLVPPLVFALLAWGGARLDGPAATGQDATAERVPVRAVHLLCPALGAEARLRLVRPDVVAGQPAGAEALVGGEQAEVGLGAVTLLGAPQEPTEVEAEGEGAAGLAGDVDRDVSAGLEAASCAAPRPSWWFSGLGAATGHRSRLTVSNVDDGPAVVEVRVHGAEGRRPVESLRGVTLAPGDVRTWTLADLVPGEPSATVQVRASRGRVVAAVDEEGAGLEATAAAAEPATRQQVPVVPAGAGPVELSVANPGEEQVRAQVRVISADGAFVPLEQGELVVPSGAAVALDLTGPLDGAAAAVEVTADGPVVVGARKTSRGRADVAAVPATGPLTGVGVAGAGPASSVLHLSAGETGAVAEVSAVAGGGEVVETRRLSVGRAGLVSWALPAATAYVVVSPTRGAPYAAVVRTGRGGGIAVVPVEPLPLERLVPRVLPYSGS